MHHALVQPVPVIPSAVAHTNPLPPCTPLYSLGKAAPAAAYLAAAQEAVEQQLHTLGINMEVGRGW